MNNLLPNGKHEVYYISPPLDSNDVQFDKFLCTGDRCKLETNFDEIKELIITKETNAPIISTNIDDSNKQTVMFNAGTTGSEKIKYKLQNIYIISPSIHTIDIDSPKSGEAILVLKSDEGQLLYLCVLLQEGSANEGEIQYSLFTEINKCMNSPDNKSETCESYSPNDFIPAGSPFVLYLTNLNKSSDPDVYNDANLFCVLVFTTPAIVPSSFINSFKTMMYKKPGDYNSILANKPLLRRDIIYYMTDRVTKSGEGDGIDSSDGSGEHSPKTVDELRKKLCKKDDSTDDSTDNSKSTVGGTVQNLLTKIEGKSTPSPDTSGSDTNVPFYKTKIFWILLTIYVLSWGWIIGNGHLHDTLLKYDKNSLIAYTIIVIIILLAPLFILLQILIVIFDFVKGFVSKSTRNSAVRAGVITANASHPLMPLPVQQTKLPGPASIVTASKVALTDPLTGTGPPIGAPPGAPIRAPTNTDLLDAVTPIT